MPICDFSVFYVLFFYAIVAIHLRSPALSLWGAGEDVSVICLARCGGQCDFQNNNICVSISVRFGFRFVFVFARVPVFTPILSLPGQP